MRSIRHFSKADTSTLFSPKPTHAITPRASAPLSSRHNFGNQNFLNDAKESAASLLMLSYITGVSVAAAAVVAFPFVLARELNNMRSDKKTSTNKPEDNAQQSTPVKRR